jgi:MFS family permease
MAVNIKLTSIPKEHRRNFFLLLIDIAWYGILTGTAINFLNIYAARLGANGFQIGLLGAVPAVVSLVLSIPAGNWLAKRPIGKAIFWMAALSRVGYLLWIPLPWVFDPQGQIWILIILAFLMGIPLCVFNVGFSAMFAATIPAELRAYVVGMRQILLSVTFMGSSLGAGYLLDHIPFPMGYQIIFGIGFVGAAMSTYNLFKIQPREVPVFAAIQAGEPIPEIMEKKSRQAWGTTLRLDIWRTPYRKVLLVFLGFHLTQFLAIPLQWLFSVNVLHLTDANIGIGTALFYLTFLIGSTQLNRIVRRVGHHKLTGWSVAGLCYYPIAMELANNAMDYYVLSAISGGIWALASGAYGNYLLERIPENDRPSHLGWYNIILNASVLFGSLAGPLIAVNIGIGPALIIFGILRFCAGIAILKWG